MITFYLIRHGLKEAVPFDPPLTTIGLEQAKAAAELLRTVEFKEILASPKTRTKQTAEIIAKYHPLKITFDERLKERMEWENGVEFEEFIKEWNKTDLDRNYVPKKGMGSFANGIQMKALVEELSEKHKDGNILIITHGGTIADLLRNLFGEENLPHIISTLTNAKYIDIAECSITTIQKSGDKYTLLKLGDISHLSIPLT
ncbi:MAG TPA: histidine phosphatase family protein [Candidatus Levybacteria bacterium]|nr:histidine phosphatase family protein [Candidatus Levybacteria bacterium]